MGSACYLCGSNAVAALPLGGQLSITTDGQFIPLPLSKEQCAACGLVQTAQQFEDIFSHLSYQHNYAFYDRPNMRVFDTPRYKGYAEWVASVFPKETKGLRVLEVGCGAGWVLENLQAMHPGIQAQGIEPSESATNAAREAGITVNQTLSDDSALAPLHGQFDVVYSINVIEHTPDPAAFLRSMAKFVRPGGIVAAICPYGDVVDINMLFLDHLYTIRKENLRHIFAKNGIAPTHWSRGPGGLSEFQMATGTPGQASPLAPHACPPALLAKRETYVREWQKLGDALEARLPASTPLLCFGAGETSDVIKTFAPAFFARVGAYVVDPVPAELRRDTYRDKPLYYLDDPRIDHASALLLGIKPAYQPAVSARLAPDFAHILRWDDLVEDRVEVGGEP